MERVEKSPDLTPPLAIHHRADVDRVSDSGTHFNRGWEGLKKKSGFNPPLPGIHHRAGAVALSNP